MSRSVFFLLLVTLPPLIHLNNTKIRILKMMIKIKITEVPSITVDFINFLYAVFVFSFLTNLCIFIIIIIAITVFFYFMYPRQKAAKKKNVVKRKLLWKCCICHSTFAGISFIEIKEKWKMQYKWGKRSRAKIIIIIT